MSTTTQENVTLTKKSGKGRRHGVVSEVSAFFHVKPGHEAALRAAFDRFHARLESAPLDFMQRFGLQGMRHVIFDNGTRMYWETLFDTDFEPYVDDSVATLGLRTWHDWFQHCEECPENLLDLSPKGLRDFIQSAQVQSAGFYVTLSTKTIGELRKAIRVQEALDQVAQTPEGLAALKNPALKPLLDEAAD
jgi:hypothetical protein